VYPDGARYADDDDLEHLHEWTGELAEYWTEVIDQIVSYDDAYDLSPLATAP
jgi:hypothetical protein